MGTFCALPAFCALPELWLARIFYSRLESFNSYEIRFFAAHIFSHLMRAAGSGEFTDGIPVTLINQVIGSQPGAANTHDIG